ncbi:MAG: twin-arginine translocation signal domain-containing protein, partial [Chloroflexota bacterium]
MDQINRIVEQARRNGYRLSRRDVLKAAAAGSLGMLLTACGANPPAAAPPQTPAAGGGAAKAPTPGAAPAQASAPTQSAAPKKGGRLVFATKVDTPNLEPHMEISDPRMKRSMLMYDTLVEW